MGMECDKGGAVPRTVMANLGMTKLWEWSITDNYFPPRTPPISKEPGPYGSEMVPRTTRTTAMVRHTMVEESHQWL